MARVSPAGTDVVQWTRDAPPEDGVTNAEGVVVASDEGDAGVCDAVGVELEHAPSASIARRAAPLARTR
jgi:hypothetical protein